MSREPPSLPLLTDTDAIFTGGALAEHLKLIVSPPVDTFLVRFWHQRCISAAAGDGFDEQDDAAEAATEV